MKSINAKNLIKKSPTQFFHRSIRQMLPKNRLHEKFYKNIIVYDGPEHDLHKIGLPQFDTFKPWDFDKVFGITADPSAYKENIQVYHDEETDQVELQKYRDEGYKIVEDPESHLRSFMKRKSYERIDEREYRRYHVKILKKRIHRLKKIRMKNFTYL